MTETPPPVYWEAPPPTGEPRGGRSPWANAAAVVLLILGVLALLAGLAVLAVGQLADEVVRSGAVPFPGADPSVADAFGQIFTIAAVIVLVFGAAYVAVGVGVLKARTGARWAGIVLAAVGGLLTVVSIAGGTDAAGTDGSVLVPLIVLGAHVFIAAALALRWHPTRSP